jgi:hypothetical protein
MRARALKPVMRTIVALLSAGLAAALPLACGSGAPSASTLVQETFGAHAPVNSGRLQLSVYLAAPTGAVDRSATVGQPLTLHVSGSFQRASEPVQGANGSVQGSNGPRQGAGAGQLPSFALTMNLLAGGRPLRVAATSVGGRFYVQLAGAWFLAPASTVQALTQGYAGAAGAGFAPLCVDLGGWLQRPAMLGTVTVGGMRTAHLRASLNAANFLADVHRLTGTGLLSRAQISALARAVRTARMDLYTGSTDHLLRSLSLTAPGLAIQLRFSDLGRPQEIVAPSHPRPLSELVSQLRGLNVGG